MKPKYKIRKTNYEEIMNKKLDELNIIVHIFSVKINMVEGKIKNKRKIYIMYGVDINGYKQIIGIYEENVENNRYWIEELEKIKGRGLKKVLYVSTETNKRLEQALKMIYNPIIKIGVNEDIERIAKYTQYRWRSDGERELMRAYLAETMEEFKEKLEVIKEKYKENVIGIKLVNEFEKKYEKEINKETKWMRNLYCSYHTKLKIRRNFLNIARDYEEIKSIEDLVEKREEYISMFERTRIYTKKDWVQILNQIYEKKSEEIEEYI